MACNVLPVQAVLTDCASFASCLINVAYVLQAVRSAGTGRTMAWDMLFSSQAVRPAGING